MRWIVLTIVALIATPAHTEPLHVVFLSATWCGPCTWMKEKTWPDPALSAWMSEYSTFETVDVDERPERAAEFAPREVPAVAIQRGGVTLDMQTGFMGPGTLLGWLQDLDDGFVLKMPEERGRLTQSVRALHHAWIQADLGRCDKSLAIWSWIWRRLPVDEPVVGNLRLSTGGATVRALVQRCPAARGTVGALREEAGRAFAAMKTRAHLNDALTLDWAFDDTSGMDASIGVMESSPVLLDDVTHNPWPTIHYLALRGRWELLAAVTVHPEEDLLKAWAQSGRIAGAAGDPMVADHLEQDLCAMAGYLMAGLLAGGRAVEAERLGELARRLVASPFMTEMLVEVPLRIGKALPAMERWLDGHPDSDSLRERLREVLGAPTDGQPEGR